MDPKAVFGPNLECPATRGRPRLRPWNDICIGPPARRAGHPAPGRAAPRWWRQRLNATFRARLAALGRRTRALARQTATLTAGMFLLGAISNFCPDHESLRLEGLIGGRKWLPRTPAMAAGLSPESASPECAKDHRWSVQELLAYRVPPPRWTPPKRRGRPSNEMKRLIAQWCT